MNAARRPGTRGVALLALLVALALMAAALLAASEVAATARQRATEDELLFVGDQYRRAIERYWFAAPPGQPRQLPQRVEQLLLDDRYPQPVQHLRRAYADPFGGDWIWVRVGDRLAGVHSAARVAPIKQARFKARDSGFANAAEVSQWIFLFVPPAPAAAPATRPKSNAWPGATGPEGSP